jgi:hypothetical protein
MLLTTLFVLTGIVGAIVLAIEIGGVLRRRRTEQRAREDRDVPRN